LSAWVVEACTGGAPGRPPACTRGDAFDDDFQLALYLAQEVHFSDVPGFLPRLDGNGALLTFRARLEDAFVDRLRAELPVYRTCLDTRAEVQALVEGHGGPSLSRFVRDHATLPLFREVVKHRSAYQLKEADAHTLAIPHLRGPSKQSLARIQAGEYGVDEPGRRRAHAALFADAMGALGLDARPHAYLDELPASALAISTLVSTFGLSRHRRGALVGHLAAFEMTSVEPMRHYATALRRLGAPPAAARFYDVHVVADAEHERLALDLACAVVSDEPALRRDLVLGVGAALLVERRFAETLLAHPSARAALAAA
jgi:hypothetical protein